MGIYTDSSGVPGTLVANSSLVISANVPRNAPAQLNATYTTAPVLSANTWYWIVIQSQKEVVLSRLTAAGPSGSGTPATTDAYSDGLLATYGSAGTLTTNQFLLVVVYNGAPLPTQRVPAGYITPTTLYLFAFLPDQIASSPYDTPTSLCWEVCTDQAMTSPVSGFGTSNADGSKGKDPGAGAYSWTGIGIYQASASQLTWTPTPGATYWWRCWARVSTGVPAYTDPLGPLKLTIPVSDPVATPYALLETLSDSFTGAATDPFDMDKWQWWSSHSDGVGGYPLSAINAQTKMTSGVLRMNCTIDWRYSGGFAARIRSQNYKFSGSSCTWEVTADSIHSTEYVDAGVFWGTSGSDSDTETGQPGVQIHYTSTGVWAKGRHATQSSTVTWNATNMRWWRIRDDAGTARVEYTSDSSGSPSSTWTELHNCPLVNATTGAFDTAAQAAAACWSAHIYGNEASGWNFDIGQFKAPSAGPKTGSGAGTEPAPTGALTRIKAFAPRTLTGSEPAATGVLTRAKLKSLTGAQPAATGVLTKTRTRVLTGSQPAETGALVGYKALIQVITFAGVANEFLEIYGPGATPPGDLGTGTAPFTFLALVRPLNNGQAWDAIFQNGNGAGGGGGTGFWAGIDLGTSKLAFNVGASSVAPSTTNLSVPYNQWQLIAVVIRSATQQAAYVYNYDLNTWQNFTPISGTSTLTPVTPVGHSRIGNYTDGSGNDNYNEWYAGDMAWLGVWPLDMSNGSASVPSDILAIVNNGPWNSIPSASFFMSFDTSALLDEAG